MAHGHQDIYGELDKTIHSSEANVCSLATIHCNSQTVQCVSTHSLIHRYHSPKHSDMLPGYVRHVAWLCQYSVQCLVFTHLWHLSHPPPGDMNLDWNDYHLNGNCSGWGNLAQQEIPGFLTLNLLTMLSTRISVTHDRKLSQSKGS